MEIGAATMRFQSYKVQRADRKKRRHLAKIKYDRTPHLWFAWHPVETNQGWAWLERVYRHRNWYEGNAKWEKGVGMFGGPGFTGHASFFGMWVYEMRNDFA
jgi:hypothetical protein